MTGDTEGAFPIPSLPLKGNKECENSRKHLWTHSLCGFWVSPPSSTCCSPAFGAGVWDEPSCRLPGPPFLSWGMVTHVALLALGRVHESCVVLGRCVLRVGSSRMIQTRRSPQPSPEARKNSHFWSCQLQTAGSEWAPKISLQLQSSTWRILFPAVSGSVFFLPSLLNHRKWEKSFSQDGLHAWQQQNYGLRVPERCFFCFFHPITGVVMGKSLHP